MPNLILLACHRALFFFFEDRDSEVQRDQATSQGHLCTKCG
jgi:hypothetical protein